MFIHDKTRLAALTELQQDQGNGTAFFVADEGQALGLQLVGGSAGNELSEPFRFVDQEKSPP